MAATEATAAEAIRFHVVSIVGKGQGVVALRDIEPGECIISEAPLATWASNAGQSNAESVIQITGIIDALNPKDKRAWWDLADVYSDHEKTATGIWMSNAFRLESGDCFTPSDDCTCHAGVFRVISRINHACRPNCYAAWNPALGRQTCHALHKIMRGTELSIAYLGGAGAWDGSYAARTTELQAKCRFQCCCALCNASGEAFEQSETRRRRIVDLNRLLQSVAPSSHLPSSFKKGHRKDDDDLLAQTLILFQISAEEGLPAIWQRAAIIEAMMHAKRTGYAPEALAWAERGAQSARLALGAQAPTTTKFEAIVKAWSRAMAERPDEPLPGESAGQGRPTRAAAESTESTVDDTTLLLRRACVGGRTFWAFRTIHAARLPPSAAADNRPDLAQHFSTEFEAAATAMHPLLHRALVEDAVDDDKSDLLIALLCKLGKLPPGCLRSNRRLLQRRGAIGPTGCAALRQLVDSDRNVERDSVDGKSQHQLNLSFDRLEQLIGRETVKGLWRLADDLLATQRDEATTRAREAGEAVPPATLEATDAASGGYHVDLFVRRYTRDTRPWIAFHQDVSNVTLNVALSDDAHHDGGRLHAILEGRHQVITRAEGEATAHADDVMHAVSAMRGGVRYSLIAFFYVLIDTPEVACYQTIPKRELDAGSPVLG